MASLDDQERSWHPAEITYFEYGDGTLPSDALRRTLHCLARWATRYRAWIVGQPGETRTEALTGDRAALLDEMIVWLEQVPRPADYPPLFGMRLYREDELFFDQHDGVQGESAVRLAPGEFVAFQDCLAGAGLPRDLYYPESERRQVVEPVRRSGGWVVTTMTYSPRGWRRRGGAGGVPPAVPTEEQRRETFAAACAHFLASMQPSSEASSDGDPSLPTDVALALGETIRHVRAIQVHDSSAYPQHAGDTPAAVLGGRWMAMLLAEAARLYDAIWLRLGELREPGKTPDPAALQALFALLESLLRLQRALRSGPTVAPPAGAPKRPS